MTRRRRTASRREAPRGADREAAARRSRRRRSAEDTGWIDAAGMAPHATVTSLSSRRDRSPTAARQSVDMLGDGRIRRRRAAGRRAAGRSEALLSAELGEPVESDGAAERAEPDRRSESVETLGGDEVEEVEEADAERRRSHLDAPLQDPGGDQAPPDHAGAGRQGRARQQGRGADHLSVAGRALLRADAEHRPRRRRVAQDHQPQPTAAG